MHTLFHHEDRRDKIKNTTWNTDIKYNQPDDIYIIKLFGCLFWFSGKRCCLGDTMWLCISEMQPQSVSEPKEPERPCYLRVWRRKACVDDRRRRAPGHWAPSGVSLHSLMVRAVYLDTLPRPCRKRSSPGRRTAWASPSSAARRTACTAGNSPLSPATKLLYYTWPQNWGSHLKNTLLIFWHCLKKINQ